RELFSNNCAACHNLQRTIEPDLMHEATQRHPRQWLLAFTRDNEKLRASGDQYANALYNQYNQRPMPAFPQLSDADIGDIYEYIDEYGFQRHPPFPDSVLKDHPNGYYQFTIHEPGWYHVDTRPPSHP
ncbi:MAG TPA: cytochrome c, partial [Puia sp.]